MFRDSDTYSIVLIGLHVKSEGVRLALSDSKCLQPNEWNQWDTRLLVPIVECLRLTVNREVRDI
jgi:hypothetical protein